MTAANPPKADWTSNSKLDKVWIGCYTEEKREEDWNGFRYQKRH
jgi:hypothetical protein